MAEQITEMARELVRKEQNVMITRIDDEQASNLTDNLEQIQYSPLALAATIELNSSKPLGVGGNGGHGSRRRVH